MNTETVDKAGRKGGFRLSLIDIHCHILPGMDDGPEELGESVRMAGIALKDGISHIFATPHILEGVYNHKAEGIIDSVDRLKGHMPEGLSLLYGADVRVRHDMTGDVERGDIPTLNGSGYLLIEFPFFTVPPHMDNLIFNLMHRKITPIITHPERHLLLAEDLSRIAVLKQFGALVQITAMSVTGGFGREIRKVSFSMVKKGLVDLVASDAHDSTKRLPVLSGAYSEIKKEFGKDVSDRIFFENPQKILKAAKKDA